MDKRVSSFFSKIIFILLSLTFITLPKNYIQDVIFNNQKEISGFITTHKGDENYLYVDLDHNLLSFYKFEKIEDIDSIMQIVAEDFVRLHEDKYLLGFHYLMIKKDNARCFRIIQELLNDSDPSNDYKAYHLRGLIYLKSSYKELILAEKDFNRVIQSAPKPAPAYNNLGIIFEKKSKIEPEFIKRNIDSAIIMYKKATIADNSYSGAFLNLGNVYMSKFALTKDHIYRDSAEFFYRKSINLNKNSYVGYLSLGNCLLPIDRKKAFKMYDKAIQISPFEPIPYLQVGLKYYEHNNFNIALEYLQKAEECYNLNPRKYTGIKNNLSWLKSKLDTTTNEIKE